MDMGLDISQDDFVDAIFTLRLRVMHEISTRMNARAVKRIFPYFFFTFVQIIFCFEFAIQNLKAPTKSSTNHC